MATSAPTQGTVTVTCEIEQKRKQIVLEGVS
jgi:hypothetical protein